MQRTISEQEANRTYYDIAAFGPIRPPRLSRVMSASWGEADIAIGAG
jgi:hypothetical protein